MTAMDNSCVTVKTNETEFYQPVTTATVGTSHGYNSPYRVNTGMHTGSIEEQQELGLQRVLIILVFFFVGF